MVRFDLPSCTHCRERGSVRPFPWISRNECRHCNGTGLSQVGRRMLQDEERGQKNPYQYNPPPKRSPSRTILSPVKPFQEIRPADQPDNTMSALVTGMAIGSLTRDPAPAECKPEPLAEHDGRFGGAGASASFEVCDSPTQESADSSTNDSSSSSDFGSDSGSGGTDT